MPFVNGKFYMNPAYGRSVELARVAELRRDRAHAADNDADAHWVTIDHHHLLVHEQQRGTPGSDREGSRANLDRRRRIAEIARKHDGDMSMPYTWGHPTCNLFVQRVIRESGAPNPLVKKADGRMGYPGAAEWAGSPVPGWRFLKPGEMPEPGDVAARKEHFIDATGHSGIVVLVGENGHVTVMAAHQDAIGLDGSFNPSGRRPPTTYRRYTGD